MGTIADKLSKLLATKNAIKASIIAKGQTISDSDPFSSYPAKIDAIVAGNDTGIDTSDATATADDILYPETAYVNGKKVTGTIVTKSSSDLTSSGATVSIPAGYYADDVSKSVSTATQATPSIEVSSDGLITSSATQTAGYVSAGTKSATKQLTTQTKTVTPSASAQTITPDSGKFLSSVVVSGDAYLTSENIKSGVNIFGVPGALEAGINTTITDGTAAAATDIASGKTAYVNGEKITGGLPETKDTTRYFNNNGVTIDPFTAGDEDIYFTLSFANDGDRLYRSSSNINICVPTSDFGDATAADVAAGRTFTSTAGLKVTGTGSIGGGGGTYTARVDTTDDYTITIPCVSTPKGIFLTTYGIGGPSSDGYLKTEMLFYYPEITDKVFDILLLADGDVSGSSSSNGEYYTIAFSTNSITVTVTQDPEDPIILLSRYRAIVFY